jgi:hypothetical protein
MRTGTVLRFALITLVAASTMGLKCAEGPLDGGLGPGTKSLTGTWQGPIESLIMRVVLTETNGTVTGTGTMTQNGVPFALSVTGTSSGGNFSLNVAEVEHEPFTYTGSVQGAGSGTTMTGVANGSGFVNQAVTLTKQ